MSSPIQRFRTPKPRPMGKSSMFSPRVAPRRRGVPRILALFSPKRARPHIVLVARTPAYSRRSRRGGHRQRAGSADARSRSSSESDGDGPAPPPSPPRCVWWGQLRVLVLKASLSKFFSIESRGITYPDFGLLAKAPLQAVLLEQAHDGGGGGKT